MAKGRKSKPTHLKLVTGNPGRRPLNPKEAKVLPAPKLPEPPEHLCADARAEWQRVAPELHTAGLLTHLDRAALAAYCQAYGRWRQAERAIAELAAADPATGGLIVTKPSGNKAPNPLVSIANKAVSDMVRFAAEFGLTPAARARVQAAPPGDDQDPTDKYFS